MGDPFSIATGVAGLISLGITLCDGLHTYFSAIKDRKDDLAIVKQNLALFKFHIFAVQSSASKLGHRHSPAIDGLQLSLINCEMQLKSLQALLDELMPTQDPSLAKEIWKKQKLIARYPFDRKKLVQLEEYLSRANTTLSSFIQALNLDINIRMSDDLEAFKTSLVTLDINTQTTLRTITTRLDVIGAKVGPSTSQHVPSRVKCVTASSSNSAVLQQVAVGVAETKTSLSGNVRVFEALTNADSTPRYLQNAKLERRLFKELSEMDCTCGASNSKTSNRPASRVYRFWGGLTVSRQGDVRANHRPGCIFFRKSKGNILKTSVTYFGLLSLFSRSFTVSLTQEYPAGPYSISFELQPCNIVYSSPAFQVCLIWPQSLNSASGPDKIGLGLDQVAENIINELRTIYSSGRASPFDVDQYGSNIAFKFLQTWKLYFAYDETSKSCGIAINAFCKLLTYLADIGVPISASNFKQHNIFTLSMQSYRTFWILPRLYKLVTKRDRIYYAELAHSALFPVDTALANGEKCVREIATLCEDSEICEDIGFSELFLVVMKKDRGQLRALLAKEENIANISQVDFYDRNILHASSNWPDGLKLLLQQQDVLPLMDMSSSPCYCLTPLDYALFYSKIQCSATDQWTDCNECMCYFSVQLLLEADCSVTVSSLCPQVLAGCSLKARKLFFEHLKDRRERLRDAAIAILPTEALNRYGVTAISLPDKTARLIWRKLQETKAPPNFLPVGLVDSLKPYRDDFDFAPESFFGFCHQLKVVELAVNYGLIPIDEIGVSTLFSGRHLLDTPENMTIGYLDWLIQYDLNLELSLEPFRLSALHRMAGYIGSRLSSSLSQANAFHLPVQEVSISELQHARTLLAAICQSRALCNIPCPCSSGMFNRPLAHVLPVMLRDQDHSDSTYFFENIAANIELVVSSIDTLGLSEGNSERLYMAQCAIHILTMMSLGVRHLPICLTKSYGDLEILKLNEAWEQDWKEILDEDRWLIKELEALDEEFAAVFDLQNISIADFLSGYWLTRMEKVVADLNKPLDHHNRYELLEAGVVLGEDNADSSVL